jgi:hypothetical protein
MLLIDVTEYVRPTPPATLSHLYRLAVSHIVVVVTPESRRYPARSVARPLSGKFVQVSEHLPGPVGEGLCSCDTHIGTGMAAWTN